VTHKGSYKVSDAVRDYLDEVRAEKSLSAVKNIEYAFNVVLPEWRFRGRQFDTFAFSEMAQRACQAGEESSKEANSY
jgi:hypothetical protein